MTAEGETIANSVEQQNPTFWDKGGGTVSFCSNQGGSDSLEWHCIREQRTKYGWRIETATSLEKPRAQRLSAGNLTPAYLGLAHMANKIFQLKRRLSTVRDTVHQQQPNSDCTTDSQTLMSIPSCSMWELQMA